MKEKIFLIIGVVLFAILLVWANQTISDSKIDNMNNEHESSNSENLNNAEDSKNEESKTIHVTEATFETEVLKSDKMVLVDFYADWCAPCNMLAPTIEEIAKENDSIKVVKINVDESENLAVKYRATSIPTLVVICDGVEKNRIVGLVPKKEILSILDI